MKLTRKQVIEELNTVRLEWGELVPPEDTLCEALDYAISSLKTDEAYQLMYEGKEVYTKADMVAMLDELQLEIKEKFNDRPFSYNHHQRTEFYRDIDEVIQQKINSLKESTDDARRSKEI